MNLSWASITTLTTLTLAVGIAALSPQRQVLITYPTDAPESLLSEAKDAIEATVSP